MAPDCGEADRTWGACLLASAGRKASRLQHDTHTVHKQTHTHTFHPAMGVIAKLAHMHAELGVRGWEAATSDPCYGTNHKTTKSREQNVVNWHE